MAEMEIEIKKTTIYQEDNWFQIKKKNLPLVLSVDW